MRTILSSFDAASSASSSSVGSGAFSHATPSFSVASISLYPFTPLVTMCSTSCNLSNPISLMPCTRYVSKLFASGAAVATTHFPAALSIANASVIILKLSSRENDPTTSPNGASSTTSVTFTIPNAQFASGSSFHSGTTTKVYSNVVALLFIISSTFFNSPPLTFCAPLTKMATFLTLSAPSATVTISSNLDNSPPATCATQDDTPSNCATVGNAPSDSLWVKSNLSNRPV
mmetsp:Transcript_27263/g.41171  ORF Transcript_27263/g.41171 Transcript_27263/m.41171 type:complete len:231 (+) Transcript_27263:433-1125(+)